MSPAGAFDGDWERATVTYVSHRLQYAIATAFVRAIFARKKDTYRVDG